MSEIVKRLRKAHDENMDRSFSPPLETQISVDFHYAALKIEDLEAENARLSTALENARKDAWQPIETAPKDGTLVLVAEQGFVEISHWHVWRLVRPAGASGVGAWVAPKSLPEEEYEIFQPTHWQPLPEPPSLTPPTEKAT